MSEFRLVVEGLVSGAVWIRPRGDLDADHVYGFDQELRRVEMRGGVSALVLDLRELAFLDSRGVSALLAARRRAARADRRIVLIEGGPTIRRILRLAGIDDAFEVVRDMPAELRPSDAGWPQQPQLAESR